MSYDNYFEKYCKEEEPKSRHHFKKSECGEIEIKAEKVFITINCEEKKERKYN